MLGLLSLNLTHVLTSDEKNCSSGNEQRAEIDTSNIRLGFVDFLPLRNPSGQYQDFRYTQSCKPKQTSETYHAGKLSAGDFVSVESFCNVACFFVSFAQWLLVYFSVY